MAELKVAPPRPIEQILASWGWHKAPRGGLRHRLYALAMDRRPWWDWGLRLMTLTGSDSGGSWAEPIPPTWWYRRLLSVRMRWTYFPAFRPSSFAVVKDWTTYANVTDGKDDQWQAIGVDVDGELLLGRRYWGEAFYGLPGDEVWLLRRYLRMWHRHSWFGLRRWLYLQGLHAAVYARRPGSCGDRPPSNQGGHDHWYCELDRGHRGFHRFNNYTWTEIGGEPIGVFHQDQR